MKWDYSAVTVWGLEQTGVEGEDRLTKSLADLCQKLGTVEVDITKARNGYQAGWKIMRGDDVLVEVFSGGTGMAAGSVFFEAKNTASEVYPILQDMFPNHTWSRLDACEDFCGEGVWDRLEKMLTMVAMKNDVSMRPFGEGHVRPDGSRDSTKGRTWYFGSKDSIFQIVLYEKGLQKLAEGIPADPTWVRLEVRVKPSSKAKQILRGKRFQPFDMFGMSRWGEDVAQYFGRDDLTRYAIGTVWKPNDIDKLTMSMVRMFGKPLEIMLNKYNTLDEVKDYVQSIKEKADKAAIALKVVADSSVQNTAADRI